MHVCNKENIHSTVLSLHRIYDVYYGFLLLHKFSKAAEMIKR